MHENDVPQLLNIKLITKNKKNLRLHFFKRSNICEINDSDTLKRKQKPTKKGQ